jgi:CheY-like chemotaxis protein
VSALQLPDQTPVAASRKPKQQAPRGIDGELLRMHVLLVDDMKAVRRLGENFLEKLGCTCVTLEDGDEIDSAWEHAARPFDAVLLDILMPRSDGALVCKHLRQDLKVCRLPHGCHHSFNLILGCVDQVHCPIIAMTAKTSSVDTQLYFKMGFDLVLPKPFTLDALGRALIEGRDRRFGETGMIRMAPRLRDEDDRQDDSIESMVHPCQGP